MQCIRCKREIPDGAAFCPWCSKRLPDTAPPAQRKKRRRPKGSGTGYSCVWRWIL
nr:MAG TPA: 50S ribosomal protein L19 [Caudoviricetes sp.]